MSTPPVKIRLDEATAYRISPSDTVMLAPLAGPSQGVPTSVFLEVWEPGGVQPDNSHPSSAEIFLILSGQGEAVSDEHVVALEPGDVLVLPEGSVHHIRNTSETERLRAVTIMSVDAGALEGGFEHLVTSGTPDALQEDDRAALRGGHVARD